MTISDQITRLNNAKAAIKQSIENKGVEVSDNALLDEYPALIESIPMEGGDPFYEELYNIRTNNGTNMAGMFSYCEAPELDLRNLDVSKATDMKYMFSYCSSSSINIDGWDTSKVTDMSSMFWFFTGLIDISKLDTSNVTDVGYMFQGTYTDNIILTGLSFPSTTSLTYMFSSAKGTILDLSSWDISNIKNMSNMFAGDFTRIDLTGWNTSNVTDMNYMFSKYSNPLEELIIPDWDMTNCSHNIFYNSSYVPNLKLIDLSRSNDATIIKIASYLPTRTATTFGTVLVPENTSQEAYDALVAKYWRPIGAALSPNLTSCSIVAELDEIMPGKSTKVYLGAYEPWNADTSNIELVILDESIATIDEDNRVTSTGAIGDIVLEARIIDTQEVIGTKTIPVSEIDSYPNLVKFRAASPSTSKNIITVNGSSKKLRNLTYDSYSDIYSYDNGAPITSIKFEPNSNINELIKLNTDSLTTTEIMFYYCQSLVSLNLSDFNNGNITNTGQMFSICSNLAELDLSNFDMTNVTETGNMFYNCSKLHTLRLDNCSNDTINKIITSANFPTNAMDGVTRTIYCKEENIGDLVAPTNWVFSYITEEEPEVPVDPPAGDIPLYVPGEFESNSEITEVSTMVTSEHDNLDSMFASCSNLTTVNGISSWDTSNVNNMNYMFGLCGNLTTLDVSNFNTSSVTTMDNIFCSCRSLATLDLSNWDVDNVTVMYGMFYMCYSLTSLGDISNWNTGYVENMADMFYNCESLTTLDLSGWNTSNVYTMKNMFYGCSKLEELDLSGWTVIYGGGNQYDGPFADISNMFYGCTNLRTLHLEGCNAETVSRIIGQLPEVDSTHNGWIYVTKYPSGLIVPEGWTIEVVEQ